MMGKQLIRPRTLGFALAAAAGLALALGVLLALPGPASAQPAAADSPAPLFMPLAQTDSGTCLGCHAAPNQVMTFPSGEQLSVTVSAEHYNLSVHGANEVACTACHTNITGFPHPPIAEQNIRQFQQNQLKACADCHAEQVSQQNDSVHAAAVKAGNPVAPLCTDCHSPHTQPDVVVNGQLTAAAHAEVAQTCSKCHSAIYDEYRQSVHGAALTQYGNNDVPTCTDCHGVHKIEDPTTARFRLNSPELCGSCHTNKELMRKYGISTDVMSTYVADFHGTTVTLFAKRSPDQETNKPVCYDCHGVHNIAATDDPVKGLALQENLMATCARCHPDANQNFPASWMSHYIPSPERSPLVYYVNLFYKIFIPSVLLPMVILVGLDAYRRFYVERRKGAAKK